MTKPIYDYTSGDYIHSLSDQMGINSEGHMFMKMSGNMAMDMETGDLHILSPWDAEDNEW